MRGRQPLALGLSLLLLGVQLVGLLHLGLERHGVCWEHGTLTELGGRRTASRDSLPAGEHSGLRARPPDAGLQDADGDHHCPVQASRTGWGTPTAASPLVLPLGLAVGEEAVGESAPRSDAGLLARAPKQSPPPTA